MSRRYWPTRPWRAGDGIGTAVYVGDRMAVVVGYGETVRVAYSHDDTHDVLAELDVIDEADRMAWAVCEVLRERIRRGPEVVRAPAPAPARRVHKAPASWAHLTGTWSWGSSATGVYVRDGGDSTRDVWRPPADEDAERALWHVPRCAAHHGLVELDDVSAREVAGGGRLDPLERFCRVVLR